MRFVIVSRVRIRPAEERRVQSISRLERLVHASSNDIGVAKYRVELASRVLDRALEFIRVSAIRQPQRAAVQRRPVKDDDVRISLRQRRERVRQSSGGDLIVVPRTHDRRRRPLRARHQSQRLVERFDWNRSARVPKVPQKHHSRIALQRLRVHALEHLSTRFHRAFTDVQVTEHDPSLDARVRRRQLARANRRAPTLAADLSHRARGRRAHDARIDPTPASASRGRRQRASARCARDGSFPARMIVSER